MHPGVKTVASCAVLFAAINVLAGCTRQAPAAHNPAAACAQFFGNEAFAGMQITAVTYLAPEGTLPARCEVQGIIRPEPGSEIGVVYRLPEDWNGKLLALGGGGWMGNTTLQAASPGLAQGYATLQTDAGHTTGTAFDASAWALNADGTANEPKLVDFSHRAIHLMTERGKQVIASHYGKPATRAYYQGCSTGGRMGLMEVQRYPEDFDGVIAGAPVHTLQTQTSAQLRSLAFSAPGARLDPAHLDLIHGAVMAACDGRDGAADGVLRDPRACDFDPGVLQCTGVASSASCLTRAQVNAVRKAYEGQRAHDGSVAAFPLEKGGEKGWVRFVPSTEAGDSATNSGGMHALRGPLLGDSQFALDRLTPNDVPRLRESWLGRTYEAADPDISAFTARGGKLLLWHGFNDPGPSARATVDYFEAVRAAVPEAAGSVQLFLAPGVAHCGGGEGPDSVDWLTALDSWVEKGQAPQQIPATKANSDLAWNLCAYPALPTGQEDGTYLCE